MQSMPLSHALTPHLPTQQYFYIFVTFYFEMIADSQEVVKYSTQNKSHEAFTQLPPVVASWVTNTISKPEN